MDLSNRHRHQLRAQGHLRSRSQKASPEANKFTAVGRSSDQPVKMDELLDYLAHSAALTERDLLGPKSERMVRSKPKITQVSSHSVAKTESFAPPSEISTPRVTPALSQPAEDKTQLGFLADVIAAQAKSIRHKPTDFRTQCSRVADKNGIRNTLGAVFAPDGFRIMTRFQSPREEKLRFYGRDGSIIEFANEDDLKASRAASMWSPGSRVVKAPWNAGAQARTAWESVHEYVSNYLPTI